MAISNEHLFRKDYEHSLYDIEIHKQLMSLSPPSFIVSKEEYERSWIFPKLKEEKMKIIFYYTNGKTFTATNVVTYTESKGTTNITYRVKKADKNIKMEANYAIDKVDLIAYSVVAKEEIKTIRLKPCATVKVEVSKK